MENLFKVEKVQLAPTEKHTSEWGKEEDGLHSRYEQPSSYGVYREDNGRWLGTVGEQYVPVQNETLYNVVKEAAELADLMADDVQFKCLQGGRKVAFQVQLPDWDMTGDDIVKRFATALNSHDGSSSMAIGMAGIRVVCSNTWMMAYRNMKKARHSASIHEQVDVMRDELLRSIEIDKYLYETFQEAMGRSYSDDNGTHDEFIRELLGYNSLDLQQEEKNTTRRENKVLALTDCINTELKSAGNNEWGLFNGVTNYVNHVEAVKKDDPEYYIYYGGGKQLVDRALNVLSLN